MRIVTYNIHKGIGGRDRRYRLQRIIDCLRHESPDILCLQEVDRGVPRSSRDDQPKKLREAFEAESWLYQLNVHLKVGVYGNLLLSKWPIVRSHQISLRRGIRKARGAQLAVIDTPEGKLHVANFHLGLSERERHWQVHRLLEHRLFRESEKLPTICIGDTNDYRNTLISGPFAKEGYQQATAPTDKFRTFPAWLPVGSLDKLFFRGKIEIEHLRVPNTKLSRTASDHRPLVADFGRSRK